MRFGGRRAAESGRRADPGLHRDGSDVEDDVEVAVEEGRVSLHNHPRQLRRKSSELLYRHVSDDGAQVC